MRDLRGKVGSYGNGGHEGRKREKEKRTTDHVGVSETQNTFFFLILLTLAICFVRLKKKTFQDFLST
uniref:Uncharacterized protein n=1 Tax=Rhizophora mucronata TaxID=61149 RepID=A0A2P2K064_RHIMU